MKRVQRNEDAHNFIHKLAYELSKNNYHLVSGYGKGVASSFLMELQSIV